MIFHCPLCFSDCVLVQFLTSHLCARAAGKICVCTCAPEGKQWANILSQIFNAPPHGLHTHDKIIFYALERRLAEWIIGNICTFLIPTEHRKPNMLYIRKSFSVESHSNPNTAHSISATDRSDGTCS